ncbi:MAG: prepilin-type N-terminal cleavage/methylation domain-containing protein [Planctomycetota bacterium]
MLPTRMATRPATAEPLPPPARRRGYTLVEVTVAVAVTATAMAMAFQMMVTISNFTEDEETTAASRTDFDTVDTRIFDMLNQAKVEVDSSLTPEERIDESWIEFRVPADTGDGNGLQNGLSPDLRWGAPKLSENYTAAHGNGTGDGKIRISFVPSYEVLDEGYTHVPAYEQPGNIWLSSINVPKMTERTGDVSGHPQEGTPIDFTTTYPILWTVYNASGQNLNVTWERNVTDPVTGVDPAQNFGQTTRFYLGLFEIQVILFQPNSTNPLPDAQQPPPSYYGGVMGPNGDPVKGTCIIAVSEEDAYNAICDRHSLVLSASYKLAPDVDGDGVADPIFCEAGRWYYKDASGAPIGNGVINALALKYMVVRQRPNTSPTAWDVFRAYHKVSFRNPMYSIKDTYNIPDLAPGVQ